MGKVAIIGGGGIRTPLVVFGINEAQQVLGVEEVVLYDPDRERAAMMVTLGRTVVKREEGALKVRQAEFLEDAVAGADFVLNSVRVGALPREQLTNALRFSTAIRARKQQAPVVWQWRCVLSRLQWSRHAWYTSLLRRRG